MSMFCGLPISVAAEPTFAAAARASRNGMGSRRGPAHDSTTIGAIARHTTSFASTADSPPATSTSTASSVPGDIGALVMRRVRLA